MKARCRHLQARTVLHLAGCSAWACLGLAATCALSLGLQTEQGWSMASRLCTDVRSADVHLAAVMVMGGCCVKVVPSEQQKRAHQQVVHAHKIRQVQACNVMHASSLRGLPLNQGLAADDAYSGFQRSHPVV